LLKNLPKKQENLFAHPYYPQDKGKVERAIRNVSEEFIYLLKKFPLWLKGKIKEYREWYNNKRYHRGIKAIPITLYILCSFKVYLTVCNNILTTRFIYG